MEGTLVMSILNFIIMIVAGFMIIALVVFLVKDVISFLQGQGTSIFKILGKIGAVLLIVSFVFATKNFYNHGTSLSEKTDTLIEKGIEDVNSKLE